MNIFSAHSIVALIVMTTCMTAPSIAKEHDHDHGKEGHAAAEATDAHESHGEGHVDEVKLTADAISRYGITVAPVGKQVLAPTLSLPARVTFNSEAIAHVGSAVQGRAAEIKVRLGDQVRKGDELVVVESPELGEAQSDFLQKRTGVAVALSAVEPAKDTADRARKLYDENQGIALGEVQKRQAEFKAAEGAQQTAQAAAKAAENKLHLLGMDQPAVEALSKSGEIDPHYRIRAAIDGQIVEREITLGELVSPEKEQLMVIANLEALWIVADAPESALKHIQIGSNASLRITATGEEPIAGKVSFIAPTLDPNTRTAQVRIEVSNKDGKLKPGMFAIAELAASSSSESPAAIVVPDEAIQTVEGGPAVFVPVEGEENTFAKRPVIVGTPIGGMVPVMSGLKEGEPVVIKGSFILKAELGKSEASHEH